MLPSGRLSELNMDKDTMSAKLHGEYVQEVHGTLEKCQFVEETLRGYIRLVIDIVNKKVGDIFPVQFNEKDLSKLSLGRLVNIFSRLSDNSSLKSSLRKITPERNYVAHQSLLFTLGELNDPKHLSKTLLKMQGIKKHAKEVHEALLDETWKLRKELSVLRHQRKKGNL